MGVIDFIGAGPGDPELLTLKARRLIAEADLILYAGSLVNPAVLQHARPDALRLDTAGMTLEEQIARMQAAVQAGQRVARLHTGDPSIFGAIHEQLQAARALGLPWRITPGVSSAFAAAAALGIEYTTPGLTQTVIFTRLPGRTPVPDTERLRDLAAHRAGLVIFLSAGMIDQIVDELRAAGYAPETPVAVAQRASWPDERIVRGVLADISARCLAAEVTHQALVVVSPALGQAVGAARSHLYGLAQQTPVRQAGVAIVTLTRTGAQTGLRLSAHLPGATLYAPARFAPAAPALPPGAQCVPCTESVRQTLRSAFRAHSALVCVMASGIVVRELGPLLSSKRDDPGVVVVDEQGRFAVSLVGGHAGGANHLARQVAEALGGQAVITTASDGQSLPALDLLGAQHGWRLQSGDGMTAVIGALVNGDPVGLFQDAGDTSWQRGLSPTQPLPFNLLRFDAWEALLESRRRLSAALLITHRQLPVIDLPTVVYHPPCLAVGVGCNRGATADEICAAIDQTLEDAGLSPLSVLCVATIAHKAQEPGLLAACERKAWPLRVFSTGEIDRADAMPNPSPWARQVLGVSGVAEPAAWLAARSETGVSDLIVEKRKYPNVTVAVAIQRVPAPTQRATDAQTGTLTVVGIGPGDVDHLTPAARAALEQADVLVGYRPYLALIESIAPHVLREAGGMRSEVARVRRAIDLARAGRRVALVSGGDAGVYGMAGLVFEMLRHDAASRPEPPGDIPVSVVPGVSAFNAAAALLGAPLMTDFAAVSLSDQLIPLETILSRLEALAQADLVICLYNPRGRARTRPFEQACEILLRHRKPDTPVGIVRAAYRADQRVSIIQLADLPTAAVDMSTLLVVGNSATFVDAGRMVTPRGYDAKYDLDGSKDDDATP